VIINAVWISLLFMAVAAGLDVFDRWLVRREGSAQPSEAV
jgi:hypothetical protein